MRKLRKKIYKYTILCKNKAKKNADNTEEIMHIFRKRNVPSFVTETFQRRRNFDMASIKNISINSSLPLADIISITSNQE